MTWQLATSTTTVVWRDPDGFIFTALARAASDPLVIPHRSGTVCVSQRFLFIESIRGSVDTLYPYSMSYMIRTKTERPIVKSEQAIEQINEAFSTRPKAPGSGGVAVVE